MIIACLSGMLQDINGILEKEAITAHLLLPNFVDLLTTEMEEREVQQFLRLYLIKNMALL